MTIDSIRLAAYALIAVLCFGSGWKVKTWQGDSEAAAQLNRDQKQVDQQRELVAQVSAATLTAIRGIRVTNTTIYQKTLHEITKEPMGPGCRLPAGWMRGINDARAGSDRSGADAALPRPAANPSGG